MICVQLGSNVGNRQAHLYKAIKAIDDFAVVLSKSSIYETNAWGNEDQAAFYNQLVIIDTVCNPYKLLQKLQAIEVIMGREKNEKWGPRIIDLDIITYNEKIIYSPSLIIPHQYYTERRFILEPLMEIAKDWKDPLVRKTTAELLSACEDKTEVKRLTINGE